MQSQQLYDKFATYEEARDSVEDMNANSAKLTFYVLEQEGSEMTRDELEDETLLPEGTLRDAFRKLEENDLAYRRNMPMNANKNLYGLNVDEFEGPSRF